MKTRGFYVTNSSSSSFIIAYKNLASLTNATKNEQKYLNILMNILEEKLQSVNEDWYDTDEGTIFNSSAEATAYWVERFVYSDMTLEEYLEKYPEQKEIYDNIIKNLNNGYKVIIKEVGNCDNDFREFIKELIDDENVILIDESNY